MCLLISCSNDGSVDDAFNRTITFDGNGATEGEMSVQTIGIGKETRLSANTYERTKYLFTGWNTEADGTGTSYEDRQKIKISGNITLYAQWEIIPIILDSSMGGWTDGNVYVLNSNVSIFGHIIVSGSVTLILNDGCTLTVTKSIVVNEGNSLTINASGEGSGILEATGTAGSAGIGGDNGWSCGTITINGGTVNASGTDGGAGIGGGNDGAGGTITINDGTVNASGISGGAGIGGGNYGAGGTITINDGTVNASGISGGAGIGGGDDGAGGTITINGGTVNASGIYGGTGIGSGLGGADDGTLKLGSGVSLEVSSDGSDWSDYDGTTRQMYMRTK